ncbi:serine hydrolase [Cellulomonas xiejunii]|uniref:serine hydrolase n=1 Tax=Cellulomonas xiejunii TaxID=2968083 RepID=UPI001D0ED24D|nr:serine hydrolase domain-containing protein [Cellulomonas xiejunii]MCC2314376.1 beta-lactamase family protein [Cellulomonas xiejunii]
MLVAHAAVERAVGDEQLRHLRRHVRGAVRGHPDDPHDSPAPDRPAGGARRRRTLAPPAYQVGALPVGRDAPAGATVAVVRDGEVLTARGFGQADVDAGTPVDPDRTLFRVGSVSKLFTATAVMQLVEAAVHGEVAPGPRHDEARHARPPPDRRLAYRTGLATPA